MKNQFQKTLRNSAFIVAFLSPVLLQAQDNAKTKVELLPGFEAKSGAVFKAFILGCD